jgi:hypothetical protein
MHNSLERERETVAGWLVARCRPARQVAILWQFYPIGTARLAAPAGCPDSYLDSLNANLSYNLKIEAAHFNRFFYRDPHLYFCVATIVSESVSILFISHDHSPLRPVDKAEFFMLMSHI